MEQMFVKTNNGEEKADYIIQKVKEIWPNYVIEELDNEYTIYEDQHIKEYFELENLNLQMIKNKILKIRYNLNCVILTIDQIEESILTDFNV